MQDMEQFHAQECHQNVTEHSICTTSGHKNDKYTHIACSGAPGAQGAC